MDTDVSAAQRRGLLAVPLHPPLSYDSLLSSMGPAGQHSFDAVGRVLVQGKP